VSGTTRRALRLHERTSWTRAKPGTTLPAENVMKKAIQLLSAAAGAMVLATGVVVAQQLTVDINKVS
jgi:hypothetical protein